MEASSPPRSRIGGSWTAQLLASRRGALLIAVIAAIIAGLLIFLFVQHYKKTPTATTPVAAVPANSYVFIAGKYIPTGTPSSTVASEGLLRRTEVPTREVVAGAITDPSAITGEVSATDIAPGQQITVTDFTRAAVGLSSYLTGDQRAIAVPLDAAHGLTSYLVQGSAVDVMTDVGKNVLMLAQNVPILANTGGDVVLRVTDKQALQIAYASDNTKIWLTLRPTVGAQQSVGVGATGTVS